MAATDASDTGNDTGPPGWFGKVSMAGDFMSRRLAPEFVRFCDGWLSRGMAAGRERLGEHWLALYLNAPVLRFAWAPGVYGPRWWFGVLMPSCDNVGRYFPLLIAQPHAHAPADATQLDRLGVWLEHLAQAALGTLSDQGSIEAFEANLRQAPSWPAENAAVLPGAWAVRDGRLSAALAGLVAASASARLDGCSVWLRLAEPAALDVRAKLPEGQAFAELFVQRAP